MKENRAHPLEILQGRRLNNFMLHLGEVKQLRMSGWRGFTLYVQDSQGLISISPAIRGIYSIGGKDGVQPWMDLQYWQHVDFLSPAGGTHRVSLSSDKLDTNLFQILGDSIPPGGHLMVSYEDEQRIHNDTMRSLNIGIPPAITSLGMLIFMAGFLHVKNWYLSEGGFEGPRKLWGEKALDETIARAYLAGTAQEIHAFLDKEQGLDKKVDKTLEEAARQRSREVLKAIKGKLG